MAENVNYRFSEDVILKDLKWYIDKTYDSHYSKRKYQSTQFIEDCGHGEGFCMGNAIKYLMRARHKENYLEDLKKARWYLDYWIKVVEENKETL